MEVIQSAVYLLCFAASLLCMALLARSYRRSRGRLLLWSTLCFVGLALNNLLLFVDVVVLPTQVDLLPLRQLSALAGIGVLLYGFIWDAD
ncbi:DUF5985 family protein [Azospirillum sp. TSO35-2]|uniref:DUF5985 family protein n=1 Tax=Azospirillum sp. TSO35-2 TaxID=716796 RepID=UPI000D60BCB4|nr:DUF5985 family protein [Azospirillum sp. TSO35-2]PWC39831.1 hypothetical protein TSO352_07070 [Azospirillum sp. TSO35-2]